MTDYWLSKMFFDLQDPKAAAAYREDRASVIERYPLSEPVKEALRNDDVAAVAPHVNPYLLRYYFAAAGMPDGEFIARLRASRATGGQSNGG